MRSTPTALAVSAAVLALLATPAGAQGRKGQAQPATTAVQAGERTLAISKEARPTIAALQTAVRARDAAAFGPALQAAQAAARSADDRFAVGSLQREYAFALGDKPGQIAAIEAMLASGAPFAEGDAIRYNLALAELAEQTNKLDRSAQAFEEVARLQPTNADALSNLSIIRARQGRDADAMNALNRAVQARKAAGQPVPEAWLNRVRSLAFRQKNNPLTLQANYDLLAAYPTAANWRDALQTHQSLVPLDEAAEIDRLRLMRAAGALAGERSYRFMAEVLLQRGLPGEAKAVLDEGVAKNQVNPREPAFAQLIRDANTRAAANRGTLASSESSANNARAFQGVADANYGFGNYAKAADLYRRALAAGVGDASLLNLRLGMALAQAGDKAGAQAALSQVTSGPRADLARYWLLWTNRA